MRIFSRKPKRAALEIKTISEPAVVKNIVIQPRSFNLEDFESWMGQIHSSHKLSPKMRLKMAQTK